MNEVNKSKHNTPSERHIFEGLSTDERTSFEHLQSLLSSTTFNNSSNSQILHADDPWRTLSESEIQNLLLRFCRFHSFQVKEASEHIMSTVAWRREACPWENIVDNLELSPHHGIPAALFPHVKGREGECLLFAAGRFYVRSFVNHDQHDLGVQALLEHCIYAVDGPRASSIVLVIDHSSVGLKNVDLLARVRELNILKKYYPETIKKLIFVNQPRWFHGAWRIVSLWFDKKAVERVCFVSGGEPFREELITLFSERHVQSWFGGAAQMESLRLFSGETISGDDLRAMFQNAVE